MLKEVIEFNRKDNGFKYNKEEEILVFNEMVRLFFKSETAAERVDVLISAMHIKLGTMCKLAYNGLDSTELPYPHKETIDMMVNVVQAELGENYTRVLKYAEVIVCDVLEETITDDGSNRNSIEEIENIIAMLQVELEERDKAYEETSLKIKDS